MKTAAARRWIPALVFLAFGLSDRATAQHIFLDMDGDGTPTAADVLAPSGTTACDVWLHTNQNPDGSPATCDTGCESLTINSYEFILRVTGGSVVWGTYTGSGIFGGAVTDANTTDFFARALGLQIHPPGLYKLGTLNVIGTGGAPVLSFEASTQLSGIYLTAFGTQCYGLDGDNTYKIDVDWGTPPSIARILGRVFADNDRSGSCAPDAGEPGIPGCTVTLQPGGLTAETDENGNYEFCIALPGTYTVAATPPPNYVPSCPPNQASYSVTVGTGVVAERNFALMLPSAPTLAVTGPSTVAPGASICLNVQATDPDASDVLTIQYLGGGPPSLATFTHTPSVSPATATLCGTPVCAEVGTTYTPLFSVSDGVNPAVTQGGSVTVVNGPPIVNAPGTQQVNVFRSLTLLVSATDPDGHPLEMTASGTAVDAGATFVDNENGTLTLNWIPCAPGTYNATFQAQDPCGGSGFGGTAILVVEQYRYVRGTVYHDNNASCTRDGAAEPGLFGWTIEVRDGSDQLVASGTSGKNGLYAIPVSGPGVYQVRAIPPAGMESAWTQTCPTAPGTHTVDLTCTETVLGRHFGQDDVGAVANLWTRAILSGTAKPATERDYIAYYANLGTTTVSGATLTLQLPDIAPAVLITNYSTTPPATVTASPPSVTWSLPAMAPGFYGDVSVRVRFDAATPEGLEATAVSTIEPTAGDVVPANNVYTMTNYVVSPLDPSARVALAAASLVRTSASTHVGGKSVFPADRFRRSDGLVYHIDFQNVGTATADSVAVRDTLDADLDPASIEILAATHDVSAAVQGDRIVWIFEGIALPDSGSDEPGSHGAVDFRVRPKSTAPDGEVIGNVASVFFGEGPPAVTNLVESRIDSPPVLSPIEDLIVVEGTTTQEALSASDPDSDPLTFVLAQGPSWATVTTTGPTSGLLELAPQSGDSGTVVMTVEASDGLLASPRSFNVRVFTPTGIALPETFRPVEVRLASGRDRMCLRLEPQSGAFRASDVDPASVELVSHGTGSVNRIRAVGAASAEDGATEFCFSSADVRALFATVSGARTVPALCAGNLRSGASFSGIVPMRVAAAPGALAVSVDPNPTHAGATLRFRTLREGRARVGLYDASGRVRRTLLDARIPAGYHEVPIEGGRGEARLPSGIYFYRVEAAEGAQSGRVVVLR